VTEQQRLEAVRRYDILDTPPDGAFDRITALTARVLNVPVAMVSIVDRDRIWFKSRYGSAIAQVPREPGLCASCVLQDAPWVVENARTDERSRANVLVCGEFGAQFYLGVPLRTSDGFNLGALCVLDFTPRSATGEDVATLCDLAGILMDELELRLSANRAIFGYQGELAQREVREDHIRGLMREVAHRSKNLLAIVLAIGRQSGSAGQSLEQYRERLLARVDGLARTQDIIAEEDWRGASLAALASRQVAPFLRSERQLQQSGSTLRLNPASAQHVGLALHELAANAAQHGALVSQQGRIVLSWTLTESTPGNLHLLWREEGGHTIRPPLHDGFGRLLLERVVPQAMEGTGQLRFDPAGVSWLLQVPVKQALC
jgi:two-component sensor histidine kinase